MRRSPFFRSKIVATVAGVAATLGLMGAMAATAPVETPAPKPAVRAVAAAPPPRKVIVVVKRRYIRVPGKGKATVVSSKPVSKTVKSAPKSQTQTAPAPAPPPTTTTGGS